jgi:diketogulonate reductase-like aldo/keto reductase
MATAARSVKAAEAIAGGATGVPRQQGVTAQRATRRGFAVFACEQSLKRLKTDQLDLYLLHWRQSVPLRETLEGFDALKQTGKIRHWGVSNFDVDDMDELLELPGGAAVQTNQVMYNLKRRGIEFVLLPHSVQRKIPIMAYSPLDQAGSLRFA